MPSYFRQVPDFDYVSRDPDQRQISEYATVKNLFRRGKLREDIFGNLSFFTKYKIIGDERPDNVAHKFYQDEKLDWVVLLSNNILNIQTEWPLPQSVFDEVLLEKYESYDELYNGIHHYETNEIKDSSGNLVLASGIRLPKNLRSGNGFVQAYRETGIISRLIYQNNQIEVVINQNIEDIKSYLEVTIQGAGDSSVNGTFTIKSVERFDTDLDGVEDQTRFKFDLITNNPPTSGNGIELQITGNETLEYRSNQFLINSNTYYYEYYDNGLESTTLVSQSDLLKPITNYEYELKIEDDKRNIFVLKPRYLNVVFNDMEEIMKYKKGSSQYRSRTLKRGDNIRLFS